MTKAAANMAVLAKENETPASTTPPAAAVQATPTPPDCREEYNTNVGWWEGYGRRIDGWCSAYQMITQADI